MDKMCHNEKAFTLAEVLITLGIIGVVAALTIPSLISNNTKVQYVTALKKAYSQTNQALAQMAVDNGTIGSIVDVVPAGASPEEAGDKFAEYFKIAKNCKANTGEGCFPVFKNFYDGSTAGGTQDYDNGGAYYKFITADGMSYAVSYDGACTTNAGFDSINNPLYNAQCGVLFIDVNGLKGPNVLGRDVFEFYITSRTGKAPVIYPFGGFYLGTGDDTTGGNGWWNYNSVDYCGSNGNKYGAYCSGRVIEKGWKMDY